MRNLISIVLPVYNGEERISRSIDSVINQTYDNWELIIVNDGSTDNTPDIIRQYAEKYDHIIIINNEENKKLPMSLNTGFASASGVYYTWTSDDNIYHPDALLHMAEILDNHSDIDMVYADNTVIDANGSYIEESKKEEPDELRFRSIIGACFLYRSSLAQEVGEYDPDLFLAEDYDFFLRCYKTGSLYHLNKNLYDYCLHEKSLTGTRLNDILTQSYRVLDKHFDFIYSKCNTRKDRYRLFYAMLYYLNRRPEASLLNRFYSLEPAFRLNYSVKRLKDRLKSSIKKVTG